MKTKKPKFFYSTDTHSNEWVIYWTQNISILAKVYHFETIQEVGEFIFNSKNNCIGERKSTICDAVEIKLNASEFESDQDIVDTLAKIMRRMVDWYCFTVKGEAVDDNN